MATFVLIHGSWHGGWCWDSTVLRLEQAGHRVLAPDLPGMGSDTMPFEENVLSQWADFVAELVSQQSEPVILVGHSRGGIVISEVAERVPDRVACLVYVTAFLLPNGDSLTDFVSRYPGTGPMSATERSADRKLAILIPDKCRPIIYSQASDEDFEAAAAQFCPEPIACFLQPLSLSDEKFGSVRRAYVEATRDRTITLEMQRDMNAAMPCENVISLDCDHVPQYSAPDELAEALNSLA